MSVVGRVIHIRNTGKLCFARLREGDGTELQAMLSLADVGEESLAEYKALVDIGDFVGVTGEVITSRRGELSVQATSWSMVAKTLRPLPNEHKPLTGEARVRQRYLDMVVNPDSRQMVRTKAAVLRSLRRTLDDRGYVEVETPILQLTNGGAAARPFRTHLNAFDQPMLLRIALELDLKKAMIGGVERVYEIGRTFRNEGLDSTHAAEFSMLEAYEAYGDIETMKQLVHDLVLDAARAVGRTTVTGRHGDEIDLEQPWRSAPMLELISEELGEEVTMETPIIALKKYAADREIELQQHWNAGEILLELYEQLVEHTLVQPTFVEDYPESVRPLAKPHRTKPGLVEAFDLIIDGDRAGAGVHRAQRPGDPARAARRAVAAGRPGRPGGDGPRRGVPQGDGARHAAGRWHGDGRGPAGDAAHRCRHPGDDPLPAAPPGVAVRAGSRLRTRSNAVSRAGTASLPRRRSSRFRSFPLALMVPRAPRRGGVDLGNGIAGRATGFVRTDHDRNESVRICDLRDTGSEPLRKVTEGGETDTCRSFVPFRTAWVGNKRKVLEDAGLAAAAAGINACSARRSGGIARATDPSPFASTGAVCRPRAARR